MYIDADASVNANTDADALRKYTFSLLWLHIWSVGGSSLVWPNQSLQFVKGSSNQYSYVRLCIHLWDSVTSHDVNICFLNWYAIQMVGICTDTYVIYQGVFQKLMSWAQWIANLHHEKRHHRIAIKVVVMMSWRCHITWRRVFANMKNDVETLCLQTPVISDQPYISWCAGNIETPDRNWTRAPRFRFKCSTNWATRESALLQHRHLLRRL